MTFLSPQGPATGLETRAAGITLAVFDVDGVMTDGRLYLDEDGRETKTFHVRDGLGLKRLMQHGVQIAVISGRPSQATAARCAELGITHVHLACADKPAALAALTAQLDIADRAIAIMGDDLPDLALAESLAAGPGLLLAVADAVPALRRAAHWVSAAPGGHGAVRQACDLILDAREAR
ncbi:HAD family hydrolase [Salinisphaera sp. Q1T1-3]|uniref:KdsC family phosphatase n=1 Tax=Salinisphaera sp. Q1T1-3 TaxID=2321229 RepID=UPI000E71C92E|nr:3-deoxy-D-manno-octulosonate 8-phosphate phosphatase [Salinisphaera sp. Q1T1-3]RJS92244.1 3-deoxy-D-manno-octulosonate 8-phosphate phosphatase [Salinisphaera sp. Q1T1-3]